MNNPIFEGVLLRKENIFTLVKVNNTYSSTIFFLFFEFVLVDEPWKTYEMALVVQVWSIFLFLLIRSISPISIDMGLSSPLQLLSAVSILFFFSFFFPEGLSLFYVILLWRESFLGVSLPFSLLTLIFLLRASLPFFRVLNLYSPSLQMVMYHLFVCVREWMSGTSPHSSFNCLPTTMGSSPLFFLLFLLSCFYFLLTWALAKWKRRKC